MNSNKNSIVVARDITKIYRRGSEEIRALDGVSLDIKRGEYVAFTGPSGSGKTTLINILGCLDNPSGGHLTVAGRDIFTGGKTLSERELTKLRRDLFGYVFQNFYLIMTLTVAENVILPLAFYRKESASSDIIPLLASLGMEQRGTHLPGELSGGEMQRVAIARALVNRPEILLADEPTGNLDTKRSDEIGGLFRELNRREGITVIMVTHNLELARNADRIISLRDGRIDAV